MDTRAWALLPICLLLALVLASCGGSSSPTEPSERCEVVRPEGPSFLRILNRRSQEVQLLIPTHAFSFHLDPNSCLIYGVPQGMYRIEIPDAACFFTLNRGNTQIIEVVQGPPLLSCRRG